MNIREKKIIGIPIRLRNVTEKVHFINMINEFSHSKSILETADLHTSATEILIKIFFCIVWTKLEI